jgi:hypothetical protein
LEHGHKVQIKINAFKKYSSDDPVPLRKKQQPYEVNYLETALKPRHQSREPKQQMKQAIYKNEIFYYYLFFARVESIFKTTVLSWLFISLSIWGFLI